MLCVLSRVSIDLIREDLHPMTLLTGSKFSLLSLLVAAGASIFLFNGAASSASLTTSIGTYSGTTSQGEKFTFFVVDSACPASSSPVRLCLYASGPNNVQLLVNTTCPTGSPGYPGSSFGVNLGPSVIPTTGVVTQRQGLSPGTLYSRIVLTSHHTASGYFLAQANGCTSGRVTFTAHRTGPIKY
jgi:hypothetical protein